MTDLEWTTPADDPTRPERKPRTCYRHAWVRYITDGRDWSACSHCGKVRDWAVSRRAKSADRLGKDQERRIERVYGPRKVGEFGDAVDHLGRDFKWQAKSTRSLPPLWLAAITEPTQRDTLPASILEPMARMQALGGTRQPLVIRCYVRQGVPTRDWLFITSWAWGQFHRWHHLGYVVIPGSSFLDIHGRDEETA